MAGAWKITSGNYPTVAIAGPTAATEVTLALDSAYTYASAGDAVFWNFVAQESANLTDFWVKVSAYNGTWASTDGVIDVQIREGLNGNGIPGTTLTGSFTVTLDGSTTGWIKKSGLSIALTAGTVYCVVIGDADGGASNYVTIVHRTSAGAYGGTAAGQPYTISTTTATNGFSTAGTTTGNPPVSLVKVGSLYYGGSGFSSVASSTSNTNEKGIRFKCPDDMTFVGFTWSNNSAGFWAASRDFKLYADGTNPGGTTLVNVTGADIASGTSPLPTTYVIPAASRVDLTGGTWYRVAMDPASATGTVQKCTIGGSPDADVLAAFMPCNGDAHYIEESGGAWDDTQTSVLATFGPLLIPKTAAAGGGAAMLVNSGGLIG